MAANAATVPKKDLDAASAALLKCLSSKVRTDHTSQVILDLIHLETIKFIDLRSLLEIFLMSCLSPKSQSEATSLLSDPAQLGAVYGAEVQEGQGGGSMWMWPPFK